MQLLIYTIYNYLSELEIFLLERIIFWLRKIISLLYIQFENSNKFAHIYYVFFLSFFFCVLSHQFESITVCMVWLLPFIANYLVPKCLCSYNPFYGLKYHLILSILEASPKIDLGNCIKFSDTLSYPRLKISLSNAIQCKCRYANIETLKNKTCIILLLNERA